MKKYPAVQRREYRPAGITPHFLETIEDEPDYSDEDDGETATEQARSALQRRRLEEEDVEVSPQSKPGCSPASALPSACLL